MTEEAAVQTGEEQGKETETESGKSPEDKPKLADKYSSVPDLEEGYKNLDSHRETLERENEEHRNRIAELEERAAHEAQAQTRTTGEEQKTDRQIAEGHWKDGKYIESIDSRIEAKLKAMQKPIQDRAEKQDVELAKTKAEMAIRERRESPEKWPHFGQLEKEMSVILKDRQSRNPEYAKSFSGYGEMFDSLYSEASSRHPELIKSEKSLAAAAASGVGSGSRIRPAGGPKKEPPKTDPAVFKRFGVDHNPYQDQKSEHLKEVEEESAALEVLDKPA